MYEGTDWSPVVTAISNVNWTAVIAAMITGTAAASGPMLLWSRQSKREREGVRAALLAEVSVLVEMLEYRDYLSVLRAIEAKKVAEANFMGPFSTPSITSFMVPVADDYNKVYQGNIGRLGSLPKGEATQIVRFYHYAEAFRIDVSETGWLGKGSQNHQDFKKVGDLLHKILELGHALSEPARTHRGFWLQKAKN